MRIAVDASALAARDGIARYLRAVLGQTLTLDGHKWFLYGRGPIPEFSGTTVRADGWPNHVGRIVSLATSQPLWARRDSPDVFWGPAHRLPLWLPRATARVVTIHDVCWLKAPHTMRAATRWLDATLMPSALTQADRIIAVSRATRDDLCTAFPAIRERVVVVHEAAAPMPEPQAIEALSSFGLSGRYVLFVGTLEPRKNLPRLLRAFARIVSSVPDRITLALVGPPGWGNDQLGAEATRLGIDGRVRVLGQVDDVSLATLYRHAACLAMPSLYEGFGLPVLEALSQGTPVLIANTSSLPEVAGDAGLQVDPSSVESIADGLLRLLTDKPMHATLASRAKTQSAKFTWDRAARETLAVFDEAIKVRREKLRLGLA